MLEPRTQTDEWMGYFHITKRGPRPFGATNGRKESGGVLRMRLYLNGALALDSGDNRLQLLPTEPNNEGLRPCDPGTELGTH